jgi:hypothetical protein
MPDNWFSGDFLVVNRASKSAESRLAETRLGLLIRRSLVRAQVGEPTELVVELALSQSSGVGFLHSGDRHTFSPALSIDSDHHGENTVFPEYRDLITQLKTTASHFVNVYEKHNGLKAVVGSSDKEDK